MRCLTIILSCAFLALVTCAADKPEAGPAQAPPSFSSLAPAIEFIAECLDHDAYEKLSAACVGGRWPNGVYLARGRGPFEMLKAAHKKQRLEDRYAKREFPKDGDSFKLGGHMSEWAAFTWIS